MNTMKILAIEKEISNDYKNNKEAMLYEEALSVYKLYLNNYVREIFFNEHHQAVLILECTNIADAEKVLRELPLVKNHIIKFNLMELRPYTGLSRLFK
jgi:hypothetical protein